MDKEQIMQSITNHHNFIQERYDGDVIITTLIGSQNYKLDNDNSDIDTFSLVLPSFEDLYLARDPVAGEYEVEDGKCVYKDIRIALNLLKKTSPNSVEIFTSRYMVVHEDYLSTINKYFGTDKLKYMVHSNYRHMLDAVAGMARQLTLRNMPAGKRYSHALRLVSMSNEFLTNLSIKNILKIRDSDFQAAFDAKHDPGNEEKYNEECKKIAEYLTLNKQFFDYKQELRDIEKLGLEYITNFQKDLIKVYLRRMNEY